MGEDLPLFAATRSDDHETSIEAATKTSLKINEKRAAVLRVAAAREPQGFIDDDLKAVFSGSPESTYRKRRSELAAHGYLVNRNGEKRDNRFGHAELVWHVTDKGREVQ
jgi:hypothetical protein